MDPDLGNIDYNDPTAFLRALNPNLPAPVLRPAEDVCHEAEERSKKIFASYDALHAILLRHEATIQNRWLKKKKQQRLKILLSAWPNMPAMHRPDFDAFRKASKDPNQKGSKYRDYYLWPYINREDLLANKTLLLMLNSRGRHFPSNFASADIEAMHLGVVSSHISRVFLNEYTMVLNGADNAQEYGKLLAWDDHPDAFDWMHTQKQFQPGDGLLALEAQEKVLEFLVDCCKQILHDIPEDKLTTDDFPIQPEPRLKTETETNGFESLAVMAAEAPYRVPAELDLGRIELLLAARESAAEDHVWALREDPAYFSQHLLDTKEHRQEMLKDLYGNEHPVFHPSRESNFWARIFGTIVVEAYLELESYAELRRQAQELRLLQAKYAADISPTEDLPDEFLTALLQFQYTLSQLAKGPLGQLKSIVVASPPMRRFFVRQPPPDPASTIIQIRDRSSVKRSNIEGQLIWLLSTLWENGQTLFLARMPLVLDELERLLEAEPEAHELISSQVAKVIGDLSILAQCIKQLELYQPWARSFENNMVERESDIEQEFKERAKPWTKIVSAFAEKNLNRVAKLGNPENKKFFYPCDKRKTKENVDAMIRAEKNLDEFWAAVDRTINAQNGALEGTAVRELLSQQRILQRTPEWVDEPKVAPKDKGKQQVSSVQADDIYKPLSTLYFGQSGTSTPTETALPVRAKTKTKGQAQNITPETPTTDGIAEPIVEPKSIPVDARALKVFRTLFFNPAVTSSPGEVSWNDFLHAMTSTGIFTAEKLYGSVWQFQRVDRQDQSRIQFHEPHPRGKIPFVMARRHGRRLYRAFGWIGEMFVLKQK